MLILCNNAVRVEFLKEMVILFFEKCNTGCPAIIAFNPPLNAKLNLKLSNLFVQCILNEKLNMLIEDFNRRLIVTTLDYIVIFKFVVR